MLLLFHVSPPLLTHTVWTNKIPPPDIHFPSCDVGEKVQFHDRRWSPFYPFSKIFAWFPIPGSNSSMLLGYTIIFWTLRWEINWGIARKITNALTSHSFYLESQRLSKRYSNTFILFPSRVRLWSGAVSNPTIRLSADVFLLLDCFSTSSTLCTTATYVLFIDGGK